MYSNVVRGIIPDDALAFTDTAGIAPYFLLDLRFIDALGLTDATVARNLVTHPDSQQRVAHERQPPPGYPMARG